MLIAIAMLLSLGWLALGLHYLLNFVGIESVAFLPPYEIGLLAVALIGPVAIIWCAAAIMRGSGRAKHLERKLDTLSEQIALLRQGAGETSEVAGSAPAESPASPPKAAAAKPTKAKSDPVIATPAAAAPGQESAATSTTGATGANKPAAGAALDPAAVKEATTAAAGDKQTASSEQPAAPTPGHEGAGTKQSTPRPSPLNDGLPPFKAGKDEPKDGELIYDILRRSVRDHLNDTAMDIAAVLSAREAYSEALTKLRQGGRGAFFQLVAKDLDEGGDSARARLDRLNAWPMLDSYSRDYRRLLDAAGGTDTKLGVLIEKSELGQLGTAVNAFVAQSKAEPEKLQKAQGKS